MSVRTRSTLGSLLVTFVLLGGCQWVGWLPASSSSPSPGGEPLTEVEAKYALLAELGNLWYCDPDFYPIAFEDEQAAALRNWAEVTADANNLEAILEHLGWRSDRDLTDADKLAIYREWKVLRAMTLQASGGSSWQFDLLTLDGPAADAGHHSLGTITNGGRIEVALREPSTGPACPICLSRGTLIDTPHGQVAVERLRAGDMVWTIDSDGRRVAAPIEAIGSTRAPAIHRVVHLVLADGREAWVSPGHPTADGRTLGALRPGDQLDGARVVSAQRVAYGGGATFDLLPAGSSGAYWANGILLGSTLTR